MMMYGIFIIPLIVLFMGLFLCWASGNYNKFDPNDASNEILKVLDSDLISTNPFKESISQAEFNSFGFMNSQEKRNEISEKLHLGICNSKVLFKRMNYNRITYQIIEEAYGNKLK